MGALLQQCEDGCDEEETDYILVGDRVWITINNISVYIIRGEYGVSVELYPLNYEDGNLITETRATWEDAETQQ